jgi:hypothetical protein
MFQKFRIGDSEVIIKHVKELGYYLGDTHETRPDNKRVFTQYGLDREKLCKIAGIEYSLDNGSFPYHRSEGHLKKTISFLEHLHLYYID